MKISGQVVVSTEKRFTCFISNENMNDIIKIIKSLKDSNVLINVIIEIVKHGIKKEKADFFLLC